MTQRYVNRETDPIEAVYVFPLDEGAAVCGFEAIIDGTLVVGEVKEREEAFRMYDDAMERGDGGFLLDEERPDVFQASVGNLPPGKEVLLKLTYVTELAVAGNSLRFSIPTTVSPRYAPAEDHLGVGRTDAETLNPPVAWRVPYGLNLSVRLVMGQTISRIESPSHPVSVAMDGSAAEVTLSQSDTALDRDFVLSVESAGLESPHAWIERDDDGAQAVAVAFVPKLADGLSPCDVTFLVDRSGSMAGTSIKEVRNALQLCLRSMIPGCAFNIVGFGTRFEPLFQKSRVYDEASLAEACAHVNALEADLGGTEILPALEFVLQQPSHETLARQIVVLTDGEVTNTDAVLALVRQHEARARVFTFGIGAGSSQHLVKGLARAGGGIAEFIYPGERIEPKVVRQFGRLLSPALTDVRLNWGGLDATQSPSRVPPIFMGGRLLLYAFVKQIATEAKPVRVQLSAMSASGPLTFDVEFDPARAATGRTVGTLAARARIRELEESPEWTTTRGSRQRERKASGVRSEIIALSMRYGLMSRETSFVAIERREVPVLGDVQLRRVPIALTTGWGDLEGHRLGSQRKGGVMVSSFAASMSAGDDADDNCGVAYCRAPSVESRPRSRARQSLGQVGGSGRGAFSDEALLRGPSTEAPRPTGMHAVVALQRADGSWDLTPEFARAIGHDLAHLQSGLTGATGNEADARKAWATALALAWLDAHARDVEDEWRLLATKAQKWLEGTAARPADGGTWVDAARLLTGRSIRC